MIATLIGISSSLITILIFAFLKQFHKNTVYALILTGIAFLYVGYTWTNLEVAGASFLQTLFFLLLAYYGLKKHPNYLVFGYIIHAVWDGLYPIIGSPDLLPPDYDYFCVTYDVFVAIYLFVFNYESNKSYNNPSINPIQKIK